MSRHISICALLAITAFGLEARAAERILLANGFDLLCNHHALVGGHFRVYLQATETNYFELSPEQIEAVETVPDPPPDLTPAATAAETKAAQAPATAPKKDELLTSADLHELLSKAGSDHNVNEDLLASVVKAESGGHTRAVSHAGARGLMQLMPGTAQQMGVADSFEPRQNVQGGAAYLDSLLTRYHDNIALALAAYNAGPQAVDRYHGIPPYRETRLYVACVIHEFNRRVQARAKQNPQMAMQTAAPAALR
jgi:hypothetical protein